MRVNSITGIKTLLDLGPKIANAVRRSRMGSA
jgi:hypothetical protein